MAHVEGDDPGGAALEEDVGESAGRGADIERLAAADLYAECVERVRQLEAAAADVRVILADQRHVRLGLDLRARLADDLAVDGDLRGEDQRARAFARRGQSPVGDELIQSDLCQFDLVTIHRPMSISRDSARPAPARA